MGYHSKRSMKLQGLRILNGGVPWLVVHATPLSLRVANAQIRRAAI